MAKLTSLGLKKPDKTDYYNIDDNNFNIDKIEELFEEKANTIHTHDNRYYTETEIDEKIDDINTSLANQVSTVTGSYLNLVNTHNGGLLLKELQGKSVQNGTPSPDAKADIVSVGDDGNVVLKGCAKNLLSDITKINGFIDATTNTFVLQNQYNSIYLKIVGGKTYTVSKLAGKTFRVATSEVIPSSGSKILSTSANHSGTSITFTAESNAKYLIIMYWSSNNGDTIDTSVLLNSLQFELGSTATNYEPYQGQTVTIPLTQPLRSVGSVYDRIIKKDGLWCIERHNTQEIIQNGVQLAWINTALIGTTSIQFTVSIAYRGRVNSTVITNRFESTGSVTDAGGNVFFKTISNSVFGILTTDNESAIRNKIITWFASNPTVLIYPLKTPVYETLPQAIQDALNKLQSYPGVTNMFTTDPQQPIISVSYGKSDASALALYGENVSDNKLDKSKSVNNLITTVEGTVLDGRQGKALNEKIGNLSDLKTTSKTDLVGAVNEVNNNLDDIKTELPKKANKTDIPTSLPANGGNAATVDGFTVKSNVPVGAKFTDTVYTHPSTHDASMITGLPTSLPANGGNADTVDNIHISVVTSLPSSRDANTLYLVKG